MPRGGGWGCSGSVPTLWAGAHTPLQTQGFRGAACQCVRRPGTAGGSLQKALRLRCVMGAHPLDCWHLLSARSFYRYPAGLET